MSGFYGLFVLLGFAILVLPFVTFALVMSLRNKVTELADELKNLRQAHRALRDRLFRPGSKAAREMDALLVEDEDEEEEEEADAQERVQLKRPPAPIPAPRPVPVPLAPAPAPRQVPVPVAAAPRPAPRISRPAPPPSEPLIDWESFTGAKLFAWIGGLALFLAAAFFVKYSIDRDLFPPALRLSLGALSGFALIIASFKLDEKRYAITRHTLAAGGVGVLYTVVFAATLLYGYLPKPAGFGMLSVITAASFALAVRHKGVSVAVLAAVGAYLTPVLVNTGQGNLLMLAGYLALVDLGLALVQRRLGGVGLIVTPIFGSSLVLLMAQLQLHPEGYEVALAWWLHSAVVLALLWNAPEPDADDKSGPLALAAWLFLLAAGLALLPLPGVWALMLALGSLVAALALGSKSKAWAGLALPASASTFGLALLWVSMQSVEALQGPEACGVLFAYGLIGCLGPLFLLTTHGALQNATGWLRAFPMVVLACFGVLLLRSPLAHWIFWPLALSIGLLGLIICVLVGALLQGILLVLGLVLGGAWWLAQTQLAFSAGFFLFALLGAVAVLGLLAWLALGRIEAIQSVLKAVGGDKPQVTLQGPSAEWLFAAPVLGFFGLLGFSFTLQAGAAPLLGMAVLACFLVLCLALASRQGFRTAGLAALFGATLASSLWMALPAEADAYPTLLWALGFFALGLAVPWVLWKPARSYPSLWIGAALFEAIFGLYAVRAADLMGPAPMMQALPLVLAVIKLPFVARMLGELKGQPSRNALLAAHGGTLLFYLSCLPVLFLEGGWAGLTFTAEAVALLWLNRRIPHPGLRWTALIMAPLGAYYVAMHVPDLRGLEGMPLANPGYIALAAATLLIFSGRRLAAWPTPWLQGWPWSSDDDGPRLEPAPVFRSYAALAGLILFQWGLWEALSPDQLPKLLIQAQSLGESGGLTVPLSAFWGHGLDLAAASGLLWAFYGLLLLLSPAQLRRSLRRFGLALLLAGTVKLALLPLMFREEFGALTPLLNAPTLALLGALAAWGWLLWRQGGPAWPVPAWGARQLGGLILVGLAFWFMNVQIASVLKENGLPFTFSTRGFLARQLGFSIGWLVFGVVLLALGLSQRVKALRLAGLGLLVVASCKVFFGDLWSLGQLYRVASLVGLAAVLILASFLYQKFEKGDGDEKRA
jgi:uncharacterized membrane protein